MSIHIGIQPQRVAGFGQRAWEWWDDYTRRRGQSLAAAHLRSLSDVQLQDIGLHRGEIEFAVRNGSVRRRHDGE